MADDQVENVYSRRIDRSQVLNQREEELNQFICGICLYVIIDPMQTKCCRQIYCRHCIQDWIRVNDSCPNDGKLLSEDGVWQVPRLMLNLLNNIEVKCSYCEEGCNQVVRVETLAQHLRVCDFRPNLRCNSCHLARPNALEHDCLQSLIRENIKLSALNQKMFEQNSCLMLERKDKDHVISQLIEEVRNSQKGQVEKSLDYLLKGMSLTFFSLLTGLFVFDVVTHLRK